MLVGLVDLSGNGIAGLEYFDSEAWGELLSLAETSSAAASAAAKAAKAEGSATSSPSKLKRSPLGKLKELHVNDCGLRRLPRGLRSLPELRRLYAAGNDFQATEEVCWSLE